MTPILRRSAWRLFLMVSLLCLNACGLFSKNDAGTPGSQSGVCSVDDPAFRASFKSTLHASLQKSCYECHNAQSPKAPSPFADDSPSIAMESAKRFVDFDSPSNSAFVKRMDQGHNCGSNCSGLVQEFSSKIEEWKRSLGPLISKLSEDCSGLQDDADAKVIRTAAIHIDPNLPADGKVLLFELKDANPSLPGAAFQVRVKPFPTPGSTNYLIEKPILASQPLTGNPDQNVRVSNIHLFINGKEDTLYRNFVSTDFIIQPRLFPQGTQIGGWYVVKDTTQIVPWSGPGGDDLSFEVKLSVTNLLWNVPKIDPYICKALDGSAGADNFTAFFNLKKNDCAECHYSGGAGYPYFPMKDRIDAALCREFKRRANLDDPLSSLVYLMPQNLIPGYVHPEVIPYEVPEKDALVKWLAKEK